MDRKFERRVCRHVFKLSPPFETSMIRLLATLADWDYSHEYVKMWLNGRHIQRAIEAVGALPFSLRRSISLPLSVCVLCVCVRVSVCACAVCVRVSERVRVRVRGVSLCGCVRSHVSLSLVCVSVSVYSE